MEMANSKSSLQGVAAVIDPDYWLIERSGSLHLDSLLYDDSPDMEMMTLNSSALEKVLRNTFVEIETREIHRFAHSLRSEAIRLAKEFGKIRLLDFRHREYNLRLRRVADNFAVFIDQQTLEFNHEDVAKTLLDENAILSESELLSQIETFEVDIRIGHWLCRGRDTLSILSIILPHCFSRFFDRDMSQKALNQTTGNELARTLRLAFEFAHFIVTKLYSRIRAWEAQNRPFRIIRDFPDERTPA